MWHDKNKQYKCCHSVINKFVLLLQKGLYPHENVDNWGKKSNTFSAMIVYFLGNLNLESVNHFDYKHAEKVCNTFNMKN